MVTLHHCVSARSFRPLWTLEELGLPYELRVMPFPPRVHQARFLQLNPLGTVPLLVDGDTHMSESAAICQYLCARHAPTPLQVTPQEPGFGAFLNFLHFGEATLTFPQTLVLRYSRFEPLDRRQPQVVADYSRWFLARLRTLEPRLAKQDWLCAERFTAADISVGYALMLGEELSLSTQFTPAVQDYWQRLQARAGYARALRSQERAAIAQGVSLTPAAATSP